MAAILYFAIRPTALRGANAETRGSARRIGQLATSALTVIANAAGLDAEALGWGAW